MNRLRLMIVERQPIVLEGLEALIEEYPDIEIVATASDDIEGLEKLQHTSVDIILLEPSLNGKDGTTAIGMYLEEKPGVTVLAYSSREDEASVFRALKAGARGYVLKSAPLPQLIGAIREIHRGSYVLSPSLNPAIIKFYLTHRDREFSEFTEYEKLSERERQVFKLFAEGLETHEISEALCISPKTVAKHRSAIKKKLSVDNPVEMAHYAMRIGLLDPEKSNGKARNETPETSPRDL